MSVVQPTAADDYFFDLNGFLVLKGAVDGSLLDRLNSEFDDFPRSLELGGWYRGGQRRDYTPETGFELHQAVACGEPFEELIDHPSWIGLVSHFAGEEDSYVEGVYIDESIASIRTSGGFFDPHSGGYRGALRGRFSVAHGAFRCGQVNIILALTDIGEGDGATLVVPGSHKSNLPHPDLTNGRASDGAQRIRGAVEVQLTAGDAVLFVDGLTHAGSNRTKHGERRVIIYRYGPIWGASRFGYAYAPEWLETLSPARRRILQPQDPVYVGDPRIPTDVTPVR